MFFTISNQVVRQQIMEKLQLVPQVSTLQRISNTTKKVLDSSKPHYVTNKGIRDCQNNTKINYRRYIMNKMYVFEITYSGIFTEYKELKRDVPAIIGVSESKNIPEEVINLVNKMYDLHFEYKQDFNGYNEEVEFGTIYFNLSSREVPYYE